MKLQTAYDSLAEFLNQNGAGVLEQEALKCLAAYCKGIETKKGNGQTLQPQPLPTGQQNAGPPASPPQAPETPQAPAPPAQPAPAAPTRQKSAPNVHPLPSHSRPVLRRLAGMTPPAAPPGSVPPHSPPVTAGQTINQKKPAFASPGMGVGPLPKPPKTKSQRGRPWTVQEEAQLTQEFYSGMSACQMAAAHNRTVEAIAARLKENLHLIKERWDLVGYDEYRQAIGNPRKESPADTLWSSYEERQLRQEFASGMTGPQMAAAHHRTVGAIAKRLIKLKIIKSTDELPGYDEYVKALQAQTQGNP